MVVVDFKGRAYSLAIRGKIGKPERLGDFGLGWSDIGEENKHAGIYQSRPRKKGRIYVRMRHAIMPQPRTPLQQAGRYKFAQAIIAWNALSFEDQIVWNKKKFPVHMTGYNRFVSWYMKQADSELLSSIGAFKIGKSFLGAQ